MKKYYEEVFKLDIKGLEDIDFKIKKLDTNELLTIIMASNHLVKMKDLDVVADISARILKSFQYKTGDTWTNVIRDNGTSAIEELDYNPVVALRLMDRFTDIVVRPAFIG